MSDDTWLPRQPDAFDMLVRRLIMDEPLPSGLSSEQRTAEIRSVMAQLEQDTAELEPEVDVDVDVETGDGAGFEDLAEIGEPGGLGELSELDPLSELDDDRPLLDEDMIGGPDLLGGDLGTERGWSPTEPIAEPDWPNQDADDR